MQKLLLTVAAVFVLSHDSYGDNWPGWRGPTGMGITDSENLPQTWGGENGENIVWMSPLPGHGSAAGSEDLPQFDHNQSSPIVWQDRVFVIMVYWPNGVAQSEFPEHHVACYRTTDGKQLWDKQVPPGPWKLNDLRGGYSAPTPCTDGERVYVLFGSSEIVALDFDGQLIWRKEIAPYAWDVAIGTSPVLFEDAVLVLADGTHSEQSRLIAFKRDTGEIKWEQPRPGAGFSHSTPVLIRNNDKPQLLVSSSNAVQGLNPVDGHIEWWVDHPGDVCSPVFGGGIVYSENGRGGAGAAINPTGSGDVAKTHVKWQTTPAAESYSSPVISGDYVCRLQSPGVLKCWKQSDGELVSKVRMPNDIDLVASPVVTPRGQQYFASGGISVVVGPGPAFEVLATNDLHDPSSASPAVAGSRIYIKGGRNLYCIAMKTMPQAGKPAWKPVTTELLRQEKTGFGGLCGVVVDHGTGDLWINLSDRGMFHSTDQGQTWQRVSELQPNGRTETPGCWLLDPTGKTNRMVTALVYGAPISVSNDRGVTWKSSDSESSHIDWCAVDWTDPEMKFMLALKHEADGLLLASHDGGKSFEEVGKGYATGWVFNPTTAVVAEARSAEKPQPRLMRTADSGRTFEYCGDFSPVGNQSAQALPKLNGDTLYWLVDGGLIATTDGGMTWQNRGEVKDAQYGPIFGQNAGHMFVLTKAGLVESHDGGVTWSAPLTPPSEMNGVGGLSWLEYDPKHDMLYLMKMGSELYQLKR